MTPIRVLGPLEIVTGAGALALGTPKQRSLLALLLLRADRFVTIDEVVDELWPNDPPRSAAANVQTYAATLRRVLGAAGVTELRIETRGRSYAARLAPGAMDLTLFREAAKQGREALAAGDQDLARTRLAEALSWWRDTPMQDVPAGPVLSAHRDALIEEFAGIAEDHAEVSLRGGATARIVSDLRDHVTAFPLREKGWLLLMTALRAVGDIPGALAAYTRAHRIWVDELGLEPGPALRDLHATLLKPVEVPPSETTMPRPAQLPADIPDFTGRQDLLYRLDSLLPVDAEAGSMRLVLLSGMAGVGKSALAVHWAHRVRSQFPDGQLYIQLRGYGDQPLTPADALAWCLESLGTPAHRVPLDLPQSAAMYRSLLADRRMLVVIDDACATDQVRPLLPGGSRCLVVVTTREHLAGLIARDGGVSIDLEVLSADESRSLLRRVLGAERADTEPDAVAALAELCAHLPLALRIAAADLTGRRGRTVREHVQEMKQDLLGSLNLADDPHAAVQVAFEQSYRRLPDPARRMFRLLGLAPGPDIGPAAAAALCGIDRTTAGRLLEGLARAHLVGAGSGTRYRMHDLLRHYAVRLADHEEDHPHRTEAAERLYAHYLRHAYACVSVLYSGMTRLPLPADVAQLSDVDDPRRDLSLDEALAWLKAEQANLVAVIHHTAQHGPYRFAWLLSDSLRGFFYSQLARGEWLTAASVALAAAERADDPAGQAAARLGLGMLAYARGHPDECGEHNRHALDLARAAGWVPGEAAALANLAGAYIDQGRLVEATEFLRQTIELDLRSGATLSQQAQNLTNLAGACFRLGRLAECLELDVQAMAIYDRMEPSLGRAVILRGRAEVDLLMGRPERARASAVKALEISRAFDDREGEVASMRALGGAYRDSDRTAEALEAAAAAERLAEEAGEHRLLVEVHNLAGSVHQVRGDHRAALERYRAALRLCDGANNWYEEAIALVGSAEANLGLGRWDEAAAAAEAATAIASGSGMRVAEALATAVWAAVQQARGEAAASAALAARALALAEETGCRTALISAVAETAFVVPDTSPRKGTR